MNASISEASGGQPEALLKSLRPRRRRDRTTLMLQILQELVLQDTCEIYSRGGLFGRLRAKHEELSATVEELRRLGLVRPVTIEVAQSGMKLKGIQLTKEGLELVRVALPLVHRLATRGG